MLMYVFLQESQEVVIYDNVNDELLNNNTEEEILEVPKKIEKPEQARSGDAVSNISSGFNFLNILTLRKEYDDLNDDTFYSTKFKSFADENFIPVNLFKNKNSIFPFKCQLPFEIDRFHILPKYMKFQDHPGENQFLCKSRDQVLGNLTKVHPFNNPTNENIDNWKNAGYDYDEHPMLWAPVSKTRKTINKVLQESDYTRFLYQCKSYTSDLDVDRLNDKTTSNNGVQYWYKDSSNLPSAIRPLILSDFVTKYSKWATIADPEKWHSFTTPFQKQTATELEGKLLRLFKNKIIVVEHRRINLSTTIDNKNCPILGHYIRQGWKLSNEIDEVSPLELIFTDLNEILSRYPGRTNEEIDHGFYLENTYASGEYVDGVLQKCLGMKSVCITKTTLIDVKDSGLRDTDGLYFRDVDLVIGKMRIPRGEDGYKYPMDYLHHPNSKDGVLGQDEKSEHIELLYVNKNSLKNTPLYFNTHGMVSKIYPTDNHKFDDGLYILRKRGDNIEEVKKIDDSLRIKYGVFNSYEDACTYTQVNEEFLRNTENMYKDKLHNAKVLDAIELEKLKSQYAKDQFKRNLEMEETTREIKRIEQETKIKEMVYKVELLERELRKHEYATVPTTITSIVKNVVEIGGLIIKSFQN